MAVKPLIVSAVTAPEVFVDNGKPVYFVANARFLKDLSDNSVLRRLVHMNAASDGVEIILLVVSYKQHAAVLNNNGGSPVSEPIVFSCKPTVAVHHA